MIIQEKRIHQLLAEIQQKVKAPKSQVNNFSHFNYRSCEDILEAVKPYLDGASIILSDEIIQVGERYYVRATAILEYGDEYEKTYGYAREASEKKGMDEAQITGSSSSYARKYALNGLFALDDSRDPDTQDNTKIEKAKENPTYEINSVDAAHIRSARSIEELDKICKEMTAKKTPVYRDSIIKHYKAKKEVLEEEQVNPDDIPL